jgi:hypothetical protein
MKTNTAADEMPPHKYPYALNVRSVKSLQTRPGYDLLFATEIDITVTCPLPSGEVGIPYTEVLTVLGGVPPYTWTISAGSLPNGLSLATNGTISGTPTTGQTSSFQIHLSDVNGSAVTKNCSMTITAAVAITSVCPLPDGQFSQAYDQQLTASGGTGTLVWSITSGALPGGLSMDSSGHITGTATTPQVSTFTIHVVDALGSADSKSCQITISAGCFDFSDNFNRADGPLGSDWLVTVFTSGVVPQVIGNQFSGSAVSTAEVVNAPATNTTGYAQCDWTSYNSLDWGGPMVLRADSGVNHNWYVMTPTITVVGPNFVERIQIIKNFSGLHTILAQFDITLGPVCCPGAVPVTCRLEFAVSGGNTVLNGYVNGVLQMTVTDTVNALTTGKPGISLDTTTAGTPNTWDNFVCHTCP